MKRTNEWLIVSVRLHQVLMVVDAIWLVGKLLSQSTLLMRDILKINSCLGQYNKLSQIDSIYRR